MKKYFFCFILLITASASFTQSNNNYQPAFFSDPNKIDTLKETSSLVDKLFKEHAVKNHFPGMVYALVADGQVLYSGSYGFSDIKNKTPATQKSAFRIASMTKSITALAIVKLRDAGKLRLDDPVHLYIPEMKNQKLTKDAPFITIRDLLTHAAGFPQDDPWADRQLGVTDKELIDLIKKGLSFSTPTGTAYEYSNLGYAMLGYIIKRVTGKPYEQYINETIIRPLGMTSTYWEFSKIPKRQLAHGYRWINNNWQEEALLSHGAYGAMGGLITSLEDFIKYMNLHMNAWPPRHDTEATVAKRSSLREMHKPWNFSTLNAQYKYPGGRPCAVASAYGYGLRWTSDCEGRTTVGHSGGLPGFGSNWTFLPEYGIGVICFANVTYAPTSIINTKVLDTILAISKIKPRQLIPSRILLQRQQELMEILPGWNTKGKNIFAENFFLDYSINALRSEANELFTKAGQIKQVKEIVPTNNLRGAFIIEGEHSNIEVRFTLTPEQVPLIQEYRIREIPK